MKRLLFETGPPLAMYVLVDLVYPPTIQYNAIVLFSVFITKFTA
jgi:hypothetical protein